MTNSEFLRGLSDDDLSVLLTMSPEMEFVICLYCDFGNGLPDDRGQCLTDNGCCWADARCAAFKRWLKVARMDDTAPIPMIDIDGEDQRTVADRLGVRE